MIGTLKQRLYLVFPILVAVAMLAACSSGGSGSGGGGDTVEALTLPDRIELTNVEDEGGGASPSRLFLSAAYSDADTDYTNEVKHSWVDDTDALDMINDILGVCKDTGYDNFVNQGAYKALVREVGDSEQSQSGSSTTSTTTEQLMEMYVDVTRASDTAPMIVKIWVEEEDGPGDTAMLIRGHFTVTESVSETYPYGVMEAHFKGTTLDGDVDVFTMAMSVSADGGNVVIETVEDSEEGGLYEFHSKVQVVANDDVSQGNAYVWESDTWPEGSSESTEVFAFNEDYFKVTDESDEVSYYTKDNLLHRVYQYKLFDAEDGSKVELNSGIPFETEDGAHGYIGYYGIWAPYGTTIENGDTVTDMDGSEYTIFRSRGKLTKHTRSSIELSELTDVELSYWDCSETCSDLIVSWNGTNFVQVGTRDSSSGRVESADSNPIVEFEEWEGAWCESLRAYLRLGNLFVGDATPSDSDTVYYHAEQTIDPETATDMTLYTWEFTVGLPIDQDVVDGADAAQGTYWSGSPTEKTFDFVAADMMLYDSGDNPVVIPAGLDLDGTNLQWGYRIGALTTTQYTSENHWQAHEAEVYYTWNTGDNDWNQFATLKDSDDAFVAFDPPISFSYTHTQDNDVNADATYDGKAFRMEYDGHSVHIPWEFDEASDEWAPQINIKDGVVMGASDEYVIKATEEGLIMDELGSAPATTFPDNSVGEPDLTYDATKTAQVGDVPTTAELKVIKGEVIE